LKNAFAEGLAARGPQRGKCQPAKADVHLVNRPALFMSYAVASNIQYRLTPVDGGTLIAFRHNAMGFISDDHRTGLQAGWAVKLERIRKTAEAARA
jgi:hypothetical protein